jgi:hypothetical protein
MRKLVSSVLLLVPAAAVVFAHQAVTPRRNPASDRQLQHVADDMLIQMSKLLDLPVKEPLKESVRSREEIRAYLIHRVETQTTPAKWHADAKVLEKFGLVPRDFQLEPFVIGLLTEQIAGLYDPESKEFFVADWIPVAAQKPVMAHELTHVLQDQHFHVDSWVRAARPNDDAELARTAVIEGSAMVAMIDYVLRERNLTVRDLPDISLFIHPPIPTGGTGQLELTKAPTYIREELMFPYMTGGVFAQKFLKANSRWADLKKVFANPPASTQQVMHPDLYFKGVTPRPVTVPDLRASLSTDWKELEENVLGEFGLQAVLKQFLGWVTAGRLAPTWAGDRFALWENEKTKQTLLVYRLQLANSDDAALFFASYSQLLDGKYAAHIGPRHAPGFYQFGTAGGGVFLRCLSAECLVVEGVDRELFDRINGALGWSAVQPAR